MSGSISDVIATASLLLAVLTALLGLWNDDVTRAIDIKDTNLLTNERATLLKKIRPTFLLKSLPLALASMTIAIIFLPRAFGVLAEAFNLRGAEWHYDDMKAAFLLTEILMLALACVAGSRARKLGAKCRRLKP